MIEFVRATLFRHENTIEHMNKIAPRLIRRVFIMALPSPLGAEASGVTTVREPAHARPHDRAL